MQKIWLFIQNQSVFVYVIAGLAFFGVLTRLMLQGKLHRLLKASENMAMTQERNMKTIRNHYENNLNMDISVDHIESFIEKYILKLKYGGIPIHIWNSLTVECLILSVATAFVGIIYAIHNDFPEVYIGQILLAVILSCVVLLTMENAFRLEYYYDRLEANIADYLDNNLKSRFGRPLIKRRERAQAAGMALGEIAGQAAGMASGREWNPAQAHSIDPVTNMEQTQNDRLIAVASEIANQLSRQGYANEGFADHMTADQEGVSIRTETGYEEGMVDRTKTGYEGRGSTRPAPEPEELGGAEPEEIPEYEIRRKATRDIVHGELANDQIAAGMEDGSTYGTVTKLERSELDRRDAEIIADVLRNFFSG